MEKHDLGEILVEHPFFEGLKPDHIDILKGCASNVRFNADERIFREGDNADHFYIIRHGSVAIELYHPPKGPVIIQTIGEGEVIGWSWLVEPYKWAYDARALELTRAIALDGACLRTKCEEDHDLGYELFKRFARIMNERIQNASLQLLDIFKPSS